MFLFVGLGNPGDKYQNTRHNIGFDAADLIAPSSNWEAKYQSLFIKTGDIILAKPQTFMNLSGKAVKEILKYYPKATLVVMHDDLDFPLGTVKVMKNAGPAGHKGVQSIMDELGTKDFIRIRLGINNPELKGQMPSEDFVLRKFSAEEENLKKEMLTKTVSALQTLQTEGLELTQSRFNG
jgi:peptidyl-tRNA hydrolase, PTH1 family